MGSREDVKGIRIAKVTAKGKEAAFSSLGEKLKQLSPDGFVAIDAEFSGLGNEKDVKDDNLEVRYAALRRLADTRAIFSVGISIFNPVRTVDTQMTEQNQNEAVEPSRQPVLHTSTSAEKPPENSKMNYEVSTFDLLMKCKDEFQMSSNAGEFLVEHSFDFNEMFRKGIPYSRASTEAISEEEAKFQGPFHWGKWPRGLLWRIGRHGVPLIVHNGLFDLVFLYAAFQGPLPPTLSKFISNLLDCIPAGYCDTKVLASAAQENSSFLGYLFAKAVMGGQVGIQNSSGIPDDSVVNPVELPTSVRIGEELCALFAFKGFCHRGPHCEFAHDPFLIVQEEKEGKSAKDKREAQKRYAAQVKVWKKLRDASKQDFNKLSKKKRKKMQQIMTPQASAEGLNNCVADSQETPKASPQSDEGQAHSAGWDAFCTGLSYAGYRMSLPPGKLNKERNRIAIPMKLSSLYLSRSQFAELDKVPETKQ